MPEQMRKVCMCKRKSASIKPGRQPKGVHLKDIRLFAYANLPAHTVNDAFFDKAVYGKKVISQVRQPVALILSTFFVQQLVFG